MGIFGKIFGRGSSPSSKSITFDDSRYSFQGEQNGARIWFLPEGGGVGVYFFPCPPSLPENLSTVAQLKEFYTAKMGAKQRPVECQVKSLNGVRSIWLVINEPDLQKRGVVYLGSLTIPFKDFSFVIKMQCHEQGITGIREALVLDLALGGGRATLQDGKLSMQGCSADDEQFDSMVPQHPLSRIRRELRLIADSLRIDEAIKAQRQFGLPQSTA